MQLEVIILVTWCCIVLSGLVYFGAKGGAQGPAARNGRHIAQATRHAEASTCLKLCQLLPVEVATSWLCCAQLLLRTDRQGQLNGMEHKLQGVEDTLQGMEKLNLFSIIFHECQNIFGRLFSSTCLHSSILFHMGSGRMRRVKVSLRRPCVLRD